MRSRYVDIDDRMDDLADRMRADPELATELHEKYELSWLYHENALEGVVYSPQELATGLASPTLADATFVTALQEIRNHKIALDLVRSEAATKKLKLNLVLVRKLYDTLCAGMESKAAQDYRKDMPLHRAYFHEIAQPAKIQPLLAKLFEVCETTDYKNAHALQRAARVHHAFMQIFPFTENSGRIGRLLANLIVFNAGYRLPCIIHATDRQRYYDSLRLPEATLRDLTLEAFENALTQAEKFFAEAPPRARRDGKRPA
jgi:Fic family protein